MHLSVNTAKLVALLIHALYGIVQYSRQEDSEASVDLVLGLRVIQGETSRITDHLTTRGASKDLLEKLWNISASAGDAAEASMNRTRSESPIQFEKLRRLIEVPYTLFQKIEGRKIAHHLVWESRTRFSSNLTDEMSNRCITELYTTTGDCRPSEECLQAMLHTKNLANYALSRQLIYFTIASRNKLCRRSLLSHFAMNSSAMEAHLTELCSNVIHEMELFLSRVSADLVKLTPLQKDLLMQHVFVCGQHGFAEVVLPRLLWMTLGQQSEKGCYPLPATDAAPAIGRRLLAVTNREAGCSAHSTAVAAGALIVFLSFLLSPSGWADFHLSDRAFSVVHTDVTTGAFAELDWSQWTADRDEDSMAMGDPPPFHHGLRGDMLAFFALFIAIFVCIAGAQSYCARGAKPFYAYAYKKL